MKSTEEKIQQEFEKEYSEIMKGFENQNVRFFQSPQWTNPGDFIVKFSLYQESPNSIASTDTFINPGY